MKTLCFGKAGLIEPENLHAFAVFCQCNKFLCLSLDSLANPRLQLFRAVSQLSTDLVEVEQQTLPV